MIRVPVVLVALLLSAHSAHAVSEITRSVVGGGAIGGSSATHAVRSTLGQDVVATAASATHDVNSGFWHGGSTTTAVETPAAVIPTAFKLYQNSPNPFNPQTTIQYDVPADAGRVRLDVFGVNGRLVRTLVDREETPGRKSVEWSGRDNQGRSVPSGIYFYALQAPGLSMKQKMVMLK
jgi:hypothetical protein